MKKVLAISGGVDSMVMLSIFADDPDVVVAHFNHKMRGVASDADAEFVKKTAEKLGLPFYLGEAKTKLSSEAEAREARYKFLFSVAKKVSGKVYTAHHQNDLLESVVINFLRGTGWRGLAPFSDKRIERPLLKMTKREIYRLAADGKILFRLDATNYDEEFLRNRIRPVLLELPEGKRMEIIRLARRQAEIAEEANEILAEILPEDGRYQRAWFKDLDDATALEILRNGLLAAEISATRPQILDFLNAIRTYTPEKKFNLPGGRMVALHKHYFMV